MSAIARVNNRRRLRRVLEYLGAHAMDRAPLDDAADVASLSKFHFLRVYTAHVGETPGETRTRLRLNVARRMLATGHSVGDVANKVSYSSPQALAHAFRKHFGMSPSKVAAGSGLPMVPPRIEWLEVARVASVPFSGKIYEVHESFDRLVVACQKAEISTKHPALTMVIKGESYGEDGRQLDIQCTMATARVPAGIGTFTIPGGPYLAFRTIKPLPVLPDDAEWYFDVVRKRSRLKRNRDFVLCRPLRDPCLTPPQERTWDLLVPLTL